MKTTSLQVVALSAVLLAAGHARATYLTYEFTGTVGVADDHSPGHTLLPASIRPGSTMAGTFSFENSAPGQVAGDDGFYRGTPLQLNTTVTVDGRYTFSLTAPTGGDEIDILGRQTLEYFKRGPDVPTEFNPDTRVSFISFSAGTDTNILADADLFPTGSPFGISNAFSDQDYYFIGGDLDSLRPAPAPEPGTLTLGLVGAAGVAGLRWWRRRKRA